MDFNLNSSSSRSKRPYSSPPTPDSSLAPNKTKPKQSADNRHLKPKCPAFSKLKKLDLRQIESWHHNAQILEGNNCLVNGINSPIIKNLNKFLYLEELHLPTVPNIKTLASILTALKPSAAHLQKLTIQTKYQTENNNTHPINFPEKPNDGLRELLMPFKALQYLKLPINPLLTTLLECLKKNKDLIINVAAITPARIQEIFNKTDNELLTLLTRFKVSNKQSIMHQLALYELSDSENIIKERLLNLSEKDRILLFSQTDSRGETPLFSMQDKSLLLKLIQLKNIIPGEYVAKIAIIQCHNMMTALHKTACSGHTDAIKALLDACTDEQKIKLLTSKDNEGKTALHSAAWKGHTDAIKALLDACTDEQKIKLLTSKEDNGATPLHLAAWKGHTDAIKALLDACTDEQKIKLLTSKDNEEKTALHSAAWKGHTDAIKALLDACTDEQKIKLLFIKSNDGSNTLHYAACSGHTDAIKVLLDACTDEQKIKLLTSKDKHGVTPLHAAAEHGQTDAIKALLYACPDEQKIKLLFNNNKYGRTALHKTAWKGHTDAIKALLDACPDEQKIKLLTSKEDNGATALHYAAYFGHTDAIKALLDACPDEQKIKLLTSKDNEGKTALHAAAENGHTDAIEALLDACTDEQKMILKNIS